MTVITLRPIAKRPPERHSPRKAMHPEHDDKPISGNFLRGQQTYISGRSPLRCYYYNKQARGRWSSAERSVSGMRWNAYLSSGRATPKFEPLRTEKLPGFVKGLMKEIEAGRGRIAESMVAPKESRIAKAKAAQEGRAARKVPEEAAEGKVIRISAHPGFRHLRAVRDGDIRDGEAAVRRDERKVAQIRPGAGNDTRMTPSTIMIEGGAAAHHPEGPGAEDRSGNPQAEGSIGAHAPSHGCAGASDIRRPSRTGSKIPADAARIRRETALPEAGSGGITSRIDWTDITIRLPGFLCAPPVNDNAPGPEPVAPAVAVQGGICHSASAAVRRGIGYFSSGRRRSFQLKIAMGAAALPQ